MALLEKQCRVGITRCHVTFHLLSDVVLRFGRYAKEVFVARMYVRRQKESGKLRLTPHEPTYSSRHHAVMRIYFSYTYYSVYIVCSLHVYLHFIFL